MLQNVVHICLSDMHGLKELHDEWYFKQDMERDFVKVKVVDTQLNLTISNSQWKQKDGLI